ncbi:hypothetical protein ACQJBY_046508 [Aegilops geniculata]
MDWSLQEREKEGEEGEREERGEGAAAADGRASPTIASPPSPPSPLTSGQRCRLHPCNIFVTRSRLLPHPSSSRTATKGGPLREYQYYSVSMLFVEEE